MVTCSALCEGCPPMTDIYKDFVAAKIVFPNHNFIPHDQISKGILFLSWTWETFYLLFKSAGVNQNFELS